MSRAAVVLLGCPKNQVDAEHVLAALGLAGWTVTDAVTAADLIVLTTCAFLEAAVCESEQAIERVLDLKRRRPGTRVAVAGCLVQRFGPDLLDRFPDVDLFCGIDQMSDIPELLKSGKRFVTGRPRGIECSSTPRLVSTPRHYAFLRIADGCDNRCAYCLIPSIRGRLRSRAVPDLVREARHLARAGTRELVLIAQDTTAYGADIYRRPALPRLLRVLAQIPGLRWIRLMYAHPAHVSDALIHELARNPKCCNYIDLPVQHCSDRILRQMNRRYNRSTLERIVKRLRSLPGFSLRTTVMTGFPGESEPEFSELLDFLAAVRFERLGVYAYSPEPGTRAALMPGQLPARIREERMRRVLELQQSISRSRLRRLSGSIVQVILDSTTAGRTEWDAPDVDGTVRFRRPAGQPGDFVRCRVTGYTDHDLRAEPV